MKLSIMDCVRRNRSCARDVHSPTIQLNVSTFGGVHRVVAPCFSDINGSDRAEKWTSGSPEH